MDTHPLFGHRADARARPPAPGASARRPRVLLADGDADVHVVYGLCLEHAGYTPVHAYSAEECVRLARSLQLEAAVVTVGHCGLLPWDEYWQLAAEADGKFAVLCLTTDPRLAPESCRSRLHAVAVLTIPCEPTELLAAIELALHGPDRALH